MCSKELAASLYILSLPPSCGFIRHNMLYSQLQTMYMRHAKHLRRECAGRVASKEKHRESYMEKSCSNLGR